MRALILALALPACTLYGPPEDDPGLPDAWRWTPDAQLVPDARWDGTAPCDVQPSCPPASPGRVSVCGRLFDLEDDQRLSAVQPNFARCGNGGAPDGACQLRVFFYDALDLTGNPATAPQIAPDDFFLDDCGRYVARNMARPTAGYLGIVVDDAPPLPDVHRRTVRAISLGSGEVASRINLHALRTSVDEAWSTQAGLGADSFAERGAVLAVFLRDQDLPASGVTITASGVADPEADYYFADTQPRTRSTLGLARSTTGVNGTALLLDSQLVQHGGSGGESPGCFWASHLASSVPGLLWILPVEDDCKI